MFCKNCGNKIDSDSKFCSSCGESIKKEVKPVVNNFEVQQSKTSGSATASLVLGIIAIVIGVIAFIIFMVYYSYAINAYRRSYYSYLHTYNSKQQEAIVTALGIMALPGILSVIGLPLGVFSKAKTNKGAKIAGIILNIVTLVLCIISVILPIATMK